MTRHGCAASPRTARSSASSLLATKFNLRLRNRDLQVANRDLGTIQHIGDDGKISVRMDGSKDRIVRFDADRDAALRPRLRRDLAQLAGSHVGARPGQYGYRSSSRN